MMLSGQAEFYRGNAIQHFQTSNVHCGAFRHVGVKQSTTQRIDQPCFELIAHAAPAVAQIFKAMFPQCLFDIIGQHDFDLLFVGQAGKHIANHFLENFHRHVVADEIEDNDVLANPVEDFRSADADFEITVNFRADAALDLGVRLFGCDVRNPPSHFHPACKFQDST